MLGMAAMFLAGCVTASFAIGALRDASANADSSESSVPTDEPAEGTDLEFIRLLRQEHPYPYDGVPYTSRGHLTSVGFVPAPPGSFQKRALPETAVKVCEGRLGLRFPETTRSALTHELRRLELKRAAAVQSVIERENELVQAAEGQNETSIVFYHSSGDSLLLVRRGDDTELDRRRDRWQATELEVDEALKAAAAGVR